MKEPEPITPDIIDQEITQKSDSTEPKDSDQTKVDNEKKKSSDDDDSQKKKETKEKGEEKKKGKVKEKKTTSKSSKRFGKSYKKLAIGLYCDTCKKEVETPESLLDKSGKPHSCKVCSSRLKFNCARCKFVYGSHHSVYRHVTLICGKPKRFLCEICSFRTHWLTGLKKHMEKHKTESKN